MQREEFVQQLWLDYIHQHPDIGGLRLWPVQATPDYLALLTVNHGPFGMDALLPTLAHFGFRLRYRHAMADRGLLVTLLSPPDDGPWMVLGELQLGTLPRGPREQLQTLIEQTPREDRRGQNLLSRGRPWPMPDWETYRHLQQAHPLAGLLSVNGPRMHHAGFDCNRLGEDIIHLDNHLRQTGLTGNADRHHGIFPVSPLVDYRFYPTRSPRLAFADGDEHRIDLGGLALVQKEVNTHQERAVELLLPHHTRCEVS
ncbi:DUF1338 domain-containing protein [Halomonas urumqiensis]|uniref:2-oxoadipate dioxygenase/decarboxylase n=1 Tax=Halomonas urumqiensis TaxID=1684789 RepID=A0A2N7UPM8_9GAMM|nr:DUF1338 domain-containing protein [Halomonas urumqiensis]PMR82397.1 DUF1338 domain-containing protein [Halomonas urumqiensis]PTB04123.1 DUF1338 domain-containing protein [Halomonas urumqiensis]GHE19609.1 hypothetical protein GCM10017767_01300 [Halomonas urumqiensis]